MERQYGLPCTQVLLQSLKPEEHGVAPAHCLTD